MKRENAANYELRRGADGKLGIYRRGKPDRLATFAGDSASLQRMLRSYFDHAARRLADHAAKHDSET